MTRLGLGTHFSDIFIGSLKKLIENVIVPLILTLADHSALLEEVIHDLAALNGVLGIEANLHPLPKARGVV